jgi:hypothetical protein
MTKSDHAGDTPSRRGFARWLLLAFAGFLGLNIGAALFAATVIFPVERVAGGGGGMAANGG